MNDADEDDEGGTPVKWQNPCTTRRKMELLRNHLATRTFTLSPSSSLEINFPAWFWSCHCDDDERPNTDFRCRTSWGMRLKGDSPKICHHSQPHHWKPHCQHAQCLSHFWVEMLSSCSKGDNDDDEDDGRQWSKADEFGTPFGSSTSASSTSNAGQSVCPTEWL